jgi:BirA family biotin operon repressor/biotin-[acetyl-CoA-carboxylase] ligase
MQRLHYPQIDSTNSQAWRMVPQCAPHPLLVTADQQSDGRGRLGRHWQSPPGGAWISLAWPMRQTPPHYDAVPLIAALAASHTLEKILLPTEQHHLAALKIKWPNDLWLDGRKVAGILCERRLHVFPASQPPLHGYIVIGVGINVDFNPAALTAPLRHPITTLSSTLRRPVEVESVITHFAQTIETAMISFEHEGLTPPILRQLRARLALLGQPATISTRAGEQRGVVRTVDDRGRLILDTDAGEVPCDCGELMQCDEPAARATQ